MAEDVARNKEQPLAGVILCCTSILPELRSQLAATATEMGAQHQFDLTSDVTHMIVGEINTAKYKYVARERGDVKVLRAEWVQAVREAWVSGGDDVDLETLEAEYKFPTFEGLRVCLTGFEEVGFRDRLRELVEGNGGEFRRDLTKSVTHLVARNTEGQKYRFASLWDIKAVSVKWLVDSVERGMVLEETLYHPSLPLERQGVGAWNRVVGRPGMLEKRARSMAAASASGVQRPRKLRRVASAKLGDQTEGIWTDIVGNDAGAGASIQSVDGSMSMGPPAVPGVSSRPVILETKSFASDTTLFDRQGSANQESAAIPARQTEQPRGMWHESRFVIHGFTAKQNRILSSHLLSQDAQIVASTQELLALGPNTDGAGMYILVPYTLPRSEMPSIDDDVEPEPEIVTDMWVEKCLHSNSFVPPESHITSTPVPRFPIPEFQGMKICSTGFSGIDLLHLSKLVTLLGATYDEYLTPNASVLICQNMQPNKEKLRHVDGWNVPAVIADWLWVSVQTGEKKPFDRYVIASTQPIDQGIKREDGLLVKKTNGSAKLFVHLPPPTGDRGDGGKSEAPGQTDPPGQQADDNAHQERPAEPSRSPSPAKTQHKGQQHSNPESNSGYGLSAPLENAISELLKQKRNKNSNPTDKDIASVANPPPQRRRRQLLGRASSNSSALAAVVGRGASRASSIDTMNEDGYGSVISLSPSTKANNSRAQSFVSTTTKTKNKNASNNNLESENENEGEGDGENENKLDFFRTHNNMYDEFAGVDGDGEGDGEEPQMTQLGYDDPDAAAVREEIMLHAEKVGDFGAAAAFGVKDAGNKKTDDTRRNLVIGRLQDDELLAGWGSKRRTRSGKDRDR